MNRDKFELLVRSPMERNGNEYIDLRTRELWAVWQMASVAMAERVKTNVRRRAEHNTQAVKRELREVELAINSMVSRG